MSGLATKLNCPYQRTPRKPCYCCGLGVRRELRKECPYLALRNTLLDVRYGAPRVVEQWVNGRVDGALEKEK
jgi:hypothetical protein